jgi:hypothetical protein
VEFPGQAAVEVVDGANVVTRYDSGLEFPETPARKALPGAAALKIFSRVLAASGVAPSDVGVPAARDTRNDYPPTMSEHNLEVNAGRMFHGLKYDELDQNVTVMLQAETGWVKYFSVKFPTPPPASGALAISSSRASASSARVLRDAGRTGAIPISVSLRVVQPNTEFTADGSQDPLPGPAKVAWECYYANAKGSQAWRFWYVWIDAKTGEPLGGYDVVNSN